MDELKAPKRKVAILGDMLELGQFSVSEHQQLGAQVAEVVDVLITVGLRSRKTATAALEHGMSEKNVYQYDNIDRLVEEIGSLVKAEDTVLVKGSQSIRAERVVKALMKKPEKAPQLLVRHDSVWLAKS